MRPNWQLGFRPLVATRLEEVRCVILGREPSIEDIAVPDGFAYSDLGPLVPLDKAPLQTKWFFRAIEADPESGKQDPVKHFCLRNWAKQGVLLWNTLPWSKIGSHHRLVGLGFDDLTLHILRACYEANPKCIFVVHAGLPALYRQVDGGAITLMPPKFPQFLGETGDGFVNFHMFSKINERLRQLGEVPINWTVK